MPYDFDQAVNKANEQFPRSSGGNLDYFNIEEGNDNVCRVLTPGAVYATHFMGKGTKAPVCYGYEKGCPVREKNDEGKLTNVHADTSVRFVMFVLDRRDGKVKTGFFPYSVVKQIGALQKNPDYQFQDLPMPYDIRITYNREESNANKYRVEYKPNGPELTEEQTNELNEKMSSRTPEDIVQRMKEKQIEDDKRSGRWISPEEVTKESGNYLKNAVEKAPNKDQIESQKVQYPEEEIKPEDIPF